MEHTAYLGLSDDGAVLAFGGILLPTRNVELAEHLLRAYCRNHHLAHHPMGWETCLHRGLEPGCEFARQFLTLVEFVEPVEFRAMLVPARALRDLSAPHARDGTVARELLRVFLRSGAGSSSPGPTRLRPVLREMPGAPESWGGVGARIGGPPSGGARRLAELADVLLGAVAFRRNDRGERRVGGMGRRLACDAIERSLRRRLTENTGPSAPPFSIWTLDASTPDPFVGGVERSS